MKIIYCDIPMINNQEILKHKQKYQVKGNTSINYDGKVVFPINMVLASKLNKDENVKIVLLAKIDPNNNYLGNIDIYKQELNSINEKIGANIEYQVVYTEFDESNDKVHDAAMLKLVETFNDNADIYCDITFGPKSLPIILMSALKIADRFFNCEIKDIVYGQVNFVNGQPENPRLCNLRSLYYLNNITDTMNFDNSKDAKETLKLLLK